MEHTFYGKEFPPTSWTIIRQASEEDAGCQSLQAVCEIYWFPLYAWCRRTGYSKTDAEDLVQGFFMQLVEKNLLARADRGKGKMRSFLLTCLKRHAGDMRDRSTAAKRDHRKTVAFDLECAELIYDRETDADASPEELFDRQWGVTILHTVLARIEEEMIEAGKRELFQRLKRFLGDVDDEPRSLDEIASEMRMTKYAVIAEVQRLRRRFSQSIRQQIADTLADPTDEDIRAELAWLSSLGKFF